MLQTTDTMPHWATRTITVEGVEFTLTMGQEDEGCFIVGITDDPNSEYIDETARDTLEEAQELFNNPPTERIKRWVETRENFDVLG